MWYAQVLCHHPYAVLSTVVVVVGTCLALSLTARPLPTFNDPALGFESRGTEISKRATAWENLLESTGLNGPLVVNPLATPSGYHSKVDGPPPKHKHKVCIELTSEGPVEVLDNCTEIDNKTRDSTPSSETSFDQLRHLGQFRDSNEPAEADPFDYQWQELDPIHASQHPHNKYDNGDHTADDYDDEQHHHLGPDGFFCNDLVPEYGHIVVGRKKPQETLFTYYSLKTICEMDLAIRSIPEMQTICQATKGTECCLSWSLPNYVAFLSNKSSCRDITEKDVARVYRLLRRCGRFFDLELERGCGVTTCRHIPRTCLHNNAVYTALHYLTDAAFLQPQEGAVNHKPHKTPPTITRSKTKTPQTPHGPQMPREQTGVKALPGSPLVKISSQGSQSKQRHHLQHLGQRQLENKLSFTAIFLPIARSSDALPFFEKLEAMDLEMNNITILAMDLGLKNTLFNKLLLSDSFLLGIGGGIVIFLVWFYTGSLFITIITITTVACSLLIAYFLYVFIFEITFFPYMNILTAVIAVGLGADDTFIYCRIWNLAKLDKNCGAMVNLVSEALHHAAASISVTSVTTATAFFASFTSPITAVKCFSIYAGTVVLANLILMLTWVPACVVIAERWGASSCCLCVPPLPTYSDAVNPACSSVCAIPLKFCYWCTDTGKVFFEKILPWMIVKPRHLWIVLLGSLAVGSAFIVFYYPALRLPDTQSFQLFDRSHPFEQYDLNYKYNFWFERNLRRDIVNRLPIRIVWGIYPVDNGDYLDPSAKGNLEFDDSFDISSPESQVWLLNFCRSLRNQTFYMSTLGPLLPNCFIETFKISMERRCLDPRNGFNRFPCCENSTFPFSREVFEKCIHQGISELYETPSEFFIPGVAGPKFSKESGKMKAAVVEYDSTFVWSLAYDEMHKFFSEVDGWVKKEMETAPLGLRNGWFTSYLSFYDVQRSLSLGTTVAVAVAVSVCLVVLFLTTLNFVVSLLAIVSVAAVMLNTLAALVLLGWHLNILESVTVSVAIGLAIDLTLHYGVAYTLSPEADRGVAVVWAAARLGNPVFMASLTSICAGVAMLPASVLAYVHVGAFLAILTAISYTYSTFFFLPLLRIMGPQRGFGQLSYPKCQYLNRYFQSSKNSRMDKTVYQQTFMSESTLSTSSNCYPNAGHTPASATASTGGMSTDTHELEPLTSRRSSSRKRHPSVTRLSSGSGTPQKEDVQLQCQNNGGATDVSIWKSASRSGSLSSSSFTGYRERALRKVSLPASTGLGGSEQSPKLPVGPTLSAATILYCERESEPSIHHHHHQQATRVPSSPSCLHSSPTVELIPPKRRESSSSHVAMEIFEKV